MKALVKKHPEQGLWLEEVPRPALAEKDVLIKILQTSICGTDLHIYKWDAWAQRNVPIPMPIGHEFVGVVLETGRLVKGFQAGDRVSAEGHLVCGHCRNCRAGKRHLCIDSRGLGVHRPGCFAEYLSIPADNALLIPEGVTDDEATILDPLGNAVHTAISFDLIGEDVLITGAGPIGIMAGVVARHVGARHVVITDINEYRLELAGRLGLRHTLHPERRSLQDEMRALGMLEGFDVGLEMSGSPSALNDMIHTVKNGGKIALLGLLPKDTLSPWDEIILKGLFIKGIYGREIFETWYKMCAMIQSGLDLKPIITHRFRAPQFREAFEIMNQGRCGKIILDWRE